MSEQPVNSCQRAEELLPEYWQGELNAEGLAWLEGHLRACADCSELAAFWREMGELPAVKPDLLQRRRFDAMLANYQVEREDHSVVENRPLAEPRSIFGAWMGWLRPVPVALALVLLLASFGGGWWLRASIRPVTESENGEIASLREEVHATKQLVVLSMLRQQSANDRLQGVSYSRHLRASDPQILQALLHALQYDPSPDVRLAALDALQNAGSGTGSDPVVARELVEAFSYQKSPLVQVALVDSLVELRPPAAQALLQKISADPAYSPEVRERAAWGLSRWN